MAAPPLDLEAIRERARKHHVGGCECLVCYQDTDRLLDEIERLRALVGRPEVDEYPAVCQAQPTCYEKWIKAMLARTEIDAAKAEVRKCGPCYALALKRPSW